MSHANNKRVCLVDRRLTGHHPLYLAIFAKTFKSLGCQVVLMVEDISKAKEKICAASPEFPVDEFEFDKLSTPSVYQSKVPGFRSFFRLKNLQRDINQYEQRTGKKIEFVFFCYIDDYCNFDLRLPYLINQPFTKPFSGLLISPWERLLDNKRSDNALYTNFLMGNDNYTQIGLLPENAADKCQALLSKEVMVYPDFCSDYVAVDESSLAKEILAKAAGRKIVSLLGSISPRKCPELFIECQRKADPSKFFFVMAGKINDKQFAPDKLKHLHDTLKTTAENLFVHNDWLQSEAVFNSLVENSDLLFAFYRDFRKSSNLLTKAATFGVPIIVCDRHVMGDRVRSYDLGFAVNSNSVFSLFTGDAFQWQVNENSRLEFLKQHNPERLVQIFNSLLIQREVI